MQNVPYSLRFQFNTELGKHTTPVGMVWEIQVNRLEGRAEAGFPLEKGKNLQNMDTARTTFCGLHVGSRWLRSLDKGSLGKENGLVRGFLRYHHTNCRDKPQWKAQL